MEALGSYTCLTGWQFSLCCDISHGPTVSSQIVSANLYALCFEIVEFPSAECQKNWPETSTIGSFDEISGW